MIVPDISKELQIAGASELIANLASHPIAKIRANQATTEEERRRLIAALIAIKKTQFKTLVEEELRNEET